MFFYTYILIMPPKKNRKSIKRARKIIGGDGEKEVSSIKNFTSTRNPSPIPSGTASGTASVNNAIGSSPRSSEALYAPKKSSASRLLTVPVSAAASLSASAASAMKPKSGSSIFRYIIILLILGFFALTLILYLVKPANKSILNIYDPLTNLFKKDNKISAIDTLKAKLDDKEIVNNIDKYNATDSSGNSVAAPKEHKKYKKRPVQIPEADDTTSKLQMKPKSKAGFCYIGEDRGFRSCIEVGEGDVCMSGDIFPTEAICINPNLRD